MATMFSCKLVILLMQGILYIFKAIICKVGSRNNLQLGANNVRSLQRNDRALTSEFLTFG